MCILPEKAIPEMTYTVSGGTLNPTQLTCRVATDLKNLEYSENSLNLKNF